MLIKLSENCIHVEFHLDVGQRFSSWSCTDRSAWQHVKMLYVYVWRPGFRPHTHTLSQVSIDTRIHKIHAALLSYKALSLDTQTHFAAMHLSRSPGCHPAVVPSTHYLVSCDSISESFGPGSWTGGRLTATAKLRWQRKRAKTKSLSLHRIHKLFQQCQSCTNKLCPPETTCSVWSSTHCFCLAEGSTHGTSARLCTDSIII